MKQIIRISLCILLSTAFLSAGSYTDKISESLFRVTNQPYKDKPAPLRDRKTHRVLIHRPNHGIAHGVRQGLLTYDVINIILAGKSENKDLVKFVNKAIAKDALFSSKLEMAAAFQRTGRESEAGSEQHDLYRRYMNKSRHLFKQYAVHTFIDNKSLILFSDAITDDASTAQGESIFVKRILDSVHQLDLIRMGSEANIASIKRRVMKDLGIREKTFEYLFDKSRGYCHASGEGNHGNTPLFIQLSNNPAELVRILTDVKNRS